VSLWATAMPQKREETGHFVEHEIDDFPLGRGEVCANHEYWRRRGHTPVVRVRGRGSGRVSMAGMGCYQPGCRSRRFYAVREYRGRVGQPNGFGWRDLRDLVVRARIQLGGPLLLARDYVRLHLTSGMRQFIAANAAWRTALQLPAYAPQVYLLVRGPSIEAHMSRYLIDQVERHPRVRVLPLADVTESDDAFHVEFELPGVKSNFGAAYAGRTAAEAGAEAQRPSSAHARLVLTVECPGRWQRRTADHPMRTGPCQPVFPLQATAGNSSWP
jgi:hypothetical protein